MNSTNYSCNSISGKKSYSLNMFLASRLCMHFEVILMSLMIFLCSGYIDKDFIYHMSIKTAGQSGLSQTPYPFWNVSLPWQERVDDLVSRLTLEEVQLQMARGGAGQYGGPAPAIPRLGE